MAATEGGSESKSLSLSLCPLWGTHPTWWGKDSPFGLVPFWQALAFQTWLKFKANMDASSHP